ncbi:CYCLIN-DEPENDENT KINASE INHIBITOR 4-RELATED [Salix koriyanagi]|uniref:CYCLIN-DEPENDENT KINASE INHIBITOR 4-RELATED n=2 Tax=Salix koriyanagi TaxID=2511006 RepID=A0A9Q0UYX7_9ROSI|nr:CYCLIN-DEPENDENT KINASE INHIBITOR 4-RELATED [Salix koriyanagi]
MGENSKRVAETEIPESSITSFSKKMKFDFDFEEFNLPSLNLKLQPLRCTNMLPQGVISSENSSNSSGFLTGHSSCRDSPVSCCSSNAPVQVVKDSLRLQDLEAKSSETESSTCIDRKFRETTPSSEFHGNTDRMGSPEAIDKKENLHQRNSPAAGMPSLAEIDSFFAGAEREEQKRFAEKYNYDVVMDLPMEGHYQWICLKP